MNRPTPFPHVSPFGARRHPKLPHDDEPQAEATRFNPLKAFGSAALPLLTLALLLIVWQMIAALEIYPAFIIPPPLAVAQRFYEVVTTVQPQPGQVSLWPHVWATGSQVIVGLFIGVWAGLLVGYALANSRALDRALTPILAAVQAVPVVAYAPLLIVWFGSGAESKIITCALTVFFPMMTNTLVGLRGVPQPLRDIMLSVEADRWQMLTKLEIPAALPVLFAGLRVAAALSVIGVVVGEFVSADVGLGHLVRLARQSYDTPLVFVAVFALAALARVLYGLVAALERLALRGRSTTSNII